MDIHMYFSELAKKQSASMTVEQRKQRAINAINARWSKRKKQPTNDDDDALDLFLARRKKKKRSGGQY